MAKILRLHRTGSNTKLGWDRTGKIGHNEIDGPVGIIDPDGARASQVAVALPSPFARMHLVQEALAFVSGPDGLQQPDSVHHRLAGQFWDLWELTFNYFQRRQPGQRLKARPWHRANELAQLEANSGTRQLAQALKLYLNDARYKDLSKIHLLYFPGATPSDPPQLVGGTSPLTVLFPAPVLKPLSVQRPQGGGFYFDGRYVPLAQREQAFQDFIYQQFVSDPELAQLAPELRDSLDQNQLNRWSLAGNAQLADYPVLNDRGGNPVEIAGVMVRIRPDEGIVRSSDFTIQPTHHSTPAGLLPLVLRPGLQAPGKMYFNKTPLGQSGDAVPAQDPRPLADRLLPGPELLYPYLTIGDLLEDTILTVPYQVDATRFETGRITVAPGHQPTCWPLLPVKALYFDYFTQADLASQLSMEIDPACVRVRLRIPVGPAGSSDFVDYERAYYSNPRSEGLGRLLISNVALSIFPFVKILDKTEYNDFYKVMLIDANNIDVSMLNKSIELRFGVNGRTIAETGEEQSATAYRRTVKTDTDEGSTFYEVRGTHFDYIEVLSPQPAAGRALVVPKWRAVRQGTKKFRFAIDFGTTNTHVAYHDAPGQPPQPLTFGPEDSPVALLLKATDEPQLTPYERMFEGIDNDVSRGQQIYFWQKYQQGQFIPPLLGTGKSPYQFPIRTATSEAPSFTVETPRLLGNINIGFGINTEEVNNDFYQTNLKWGEATGAAKWRVQAFFREMLLLFKYKAVLNGGNIEATEVVWFAPLSFPDYSRTLYQIEWDALFREVFRTPRNTAYLPESSAPYFYLTRQEGVAPGVGENAAFIDIGGGTTDVLFYSDQYPLPDSSRKHRPVCSASFRFAGNDLWGDGAAEVRGSKDNGLVRFGLDSIKSSPLPPNSNAAQSCLELIVGNPHLGSEEVASILFNYEREFKFAERLLQSQHLRVLFYIHFGALIYHLGQVAKMQKMTPPRYLCFTGRGSLYLRLLSPGDSLRPLEKVAGRLMSLVMEAPVPANFEIILAADPKQTTANGGVLATGIDAESTAEAPPVLQLVGTGETAADEKRKLHPGDIDEDVKNKVLANVQHCLDLLLTDPELVQLQEKMGIKNAPGMVQKNLTASLADSFNLCRQQYAATLPPGEAIPETLFFLPLKHALYKLSRELYKANNGSF